MDSEKFIEDSTCKCKSSNIASSSVSFIDVDDDSAMDNVVFNIPPLPPPHTAPKDVSLKGTCRKYILLEILSYLLDFIHLVIWNPSTGLYKRIRCINLAKDVLPVLFAIVYDSSNDDYVVVVVTMRYPAMVVECFSLRNNSWTFTERRMLEYLIIIIFPSVKGSS